MLAARLAPGLLLLVLLLPWGAGAWAQFEDSQQNVPQPIPPPAPRRPAPTDAPEYDPVVPDSDEPWGLPDDLLAALQDRSKRYQDYARKFICSETARTAEYAAGGDAPKEQVRRYGYTLVRSPSGDSFREYRQLVSKSGGFKGGEVDDPEPFPPAYIWVFMFTPFNEPFFDFRLVDKRFDGFDLVYEIQFRGALRFTDGRDIRQWEGTVLVDAFKFTPLQIHAEPARQKERIEALYRQWSGSFNVLGFRTKKPPLGYRAQIQFRERRDEMTFPTEIRYDTFRAVSPTQIVPTRAATRVYTDYLFTGVETGTEVFGGPDTDTPPQ